MARAVRRRTSRGSSRWASRSGTARWPSLPTVTLANHTSIITGALPGPPRHPATTRGTTARRGEQVITNSRPRGRGACSTSTPGVETIHDAVHRTWPDAFTASVNEPCDTGANYSTFDFFRRGEVPPIPKDPFGLPHTTERFVRPSKDYSWSSVVDHMGDRPGARHPRAAHYRDVDYPLPRFLWCNFTLTDAAMHEGGPHSEIAAASVRDSDGRIGAILAALEQARRVRRLRVRARRRPRHGGERPDVPRRLGRRAPRRRHRRRATRPTASCISASRRLSRFRAKSGRHDMREGTRGVGSARSSMLAMLASVWRRGQQQEQRQ